MHLAKATVSSIALKSKVCVLLPPAPQVCKKSRSLSVSTKASGTSSMSEITDVAPKVLNSLSLTVKYGGSAITDGQRLGRAQAARAPVVEFDGDPAKHYTLLMVDPDAPSPEDPRMREWLHWIVANIPGSDVPKGFTITDYNGPTPPRGVHRYIFLLHEQPEGILLPKQHHTERAKFNAHKWAQAHRLGDPVAARYFKTAAGT